jgi:hypothetical protein
MKWPWNKEKRTENQWVAFGSSFEVMPRHLAHGNRQLDKQIEEKLFGSKVELLGWSADKKVKAEDVTPETRCDPAFYWEYYVEREDGYYSVSYYSIDRVETMKAVAKLIDKIDFHLALSLSTAKPDEICRAILLMLG